MKGIKKGVLFSIIVIAVLGVVCFVFRVSMGVSLQPDQETYPVGTTSINAVFKNVLPGQYYMGHRYILEKYSDGNWDPVTKDDRGAFFEDDSFSPSHGTWLTFDLTKYCDGITSGKYRIKMTMYNKKEMPEELIFEFLVE